MPYYPDFMGNSPTTPIRFFNYLKAGWKQPVFYSKLGLKGKQIISLYPTELQKLQELQSLLPERKA
jgi:hypothetical protein